MCVCGGGGGEQWHVGGAGNGEGCWLMLEQQALAERSRLLWAASLGRGLGQAARRCCRLEQMPPCCSCIEPPCHQPPPAPARSPARSSLGANDLQVFWNVTLPSIRWGLLYGIILTNAVSPAAWGAAARGACAARCGASPRARGARLAAELPRSPAAAGCCWPASRSAPWASWALWRCSVPPLSCRHRRPFCDLPALPHQRAMGEFGAVAVISGNIIGQTQTLTLYVESAYKVGCRQSAGCGASCGRWREGGAGCGRCCHRRSCCCRRRRCCRVPGPAHSNPAVSLVPPPPALCRSTTARPRLPPPCCCPSWPCSRW